MQIKPLDSNSELPSIQLFLRGERFFNLYPTGKGTSILRAQFIKNYYFN